MLWTFKTVSRCYPTIPIKTFTTWSDQLHVLPTFFSALTTSVFVYLVKSTQKTCTCLNFSILLYTFADRYAIIFAQRTTANKSTRLTTSSKSTSSKVKPIWCYLLDPNELIRRWRPLLRNKTTERQPHCMMPPHVGKRYTLNRLIDNHSKTNHQFARLFLNCNTINSYCSNLRGSGLETWDMCLLIHIQRRNCTPVG